MVAAPITPKHPPLPDPRFPNLRAEVVAGYLNAPDTMIAEVINGELFAVPLPRPRHTMAAMGLLGDLLGPFDEGREGPGGWVFLPRSELHLGRLPDIVVPDIAGWRRERLPDDFMADDAPAHIELAPDWVCEVLSDSTEAIDRGKKRRIYGREGVAHYWLIDPRDRSLEVYRLVDGRWIEVGTYGEDASVRAEPFDAIAIDLSALWRV